MISFKQTWQRIKDFAVKIWKDPVWSKVLAAVIIFVGTTIWAIINQYSITDIYKLILKLLNLEIPIYFILSILGAILLIKLIIRLFKRKEDALWNEKNGDYTFEELYKILQSQKLPVRTRGMEWSGKEAPQEDLLALFYVNKMFINMGITLDRPDSDGGYLYGVLCPKLVSYGLVERVDYKDDRTKMDLIKYQSTELGDKFYRILEKVIFLKNKKNGTSKN